MNIESFKYYYPEKPQLININQPLFNKVSENDKWVAEYKYDGSRLQLHVIDNSYLFWSRHGKQLDYRPNIEMIDELNKLNLPSGYFLFDGELRHNKVKGVYNKIIIYDVFIWNNELLINKPFEYRRKILESVFKIEKEPLGITKQFNTNFNDIYNSVISNNEIEGLVMKNMNGKLNINTVSNQNSNWMLKVRKESSRYRF